MYGRIPYLNNDRSSWAIHHFYLRRLLYYIAVWLGASPSVPLTRSNNNVPNIQYSHLTSESSHCAFSMDNSSPPSECDYAGRVAAQNNIDIETNISFLSLVTLSYDFILLFSLTPYTPYEEASNSIAISDTNMSSKPSPPMVIPYSANIPADPNLWDSSFTATSLFGTNKFLQSNVCNIACSLQCMAIFLKQRNLKGYNGNNIL